MLGGDRWEYGVVDAGRRRGDVREKGGWSGRRGRSSTGQRRERRRMRSARGREGGGSGAPTVDDEEDKKSTGEARGRMKKRTGARLRCGGGRCLRMIRGSGDGGARGAGEGAFRRWRGLRAEALANGGAPAANPLGDYSAGAARRERKRR